MISIICGGALILLGFVAIIAGAIALPEYAEAYHGKGQVPKIVRFAQLAFIMEGLQLCLIGLEVLP